MSSLDSPFDNDQYTVAWICPLVPEQKAAEVMLDCTHGRPRWTSPSDSNVYTLGEARGHNVVIAGLPSGEYGIASAVTVASQLASSFQNIRFGFLIGVGGGVPGPQAKNPDPDIRLGDVVVGDPEGDEEGGSGIIQHDMGRSTASGFKRTGHFNKAPRIVRSAIAHLKEDLETESLHENYIIPALHESRSRTRSKRKFLRPAEETDVLFCQGVEVERERRFEEGEPVNPMVHFATIASGNSVVRSAERREEIRKMYPHLRCIEMEGAGLLQCDFPYLVVRGISDYCDDRKNDAWKDYAAISAAAFATLMLSRIPANKLSGDRSTAQRQKVTNNLTTIIPMNSSSVTSRQRSRVPSSSRLANTVIEPHSPFSGSTVSQENTQSWVVDNTVREYPIGSSSSSVLGRSSGVRVSQPSLSSQQYPSRLPEDHPTPDNVSSSPVSSRPDSIFESNASSSGTASPIDVPSSPERRTTAKNPKTFKSKFTKAKNAVLGR